jgi:plastocyanin
MKPVPSVAVALSAAAVLGAFALWPAPAASAPKAYKVVEVKDGGMVKGVCRLKGEATPWKVQVFKDNEKGCGDKERDTERMIVGEGGALANCLVYLKSIDAGKAWPAAMAKDERSALVDQKGCRYLPHVQWVRPETQLVIGNSDLAEHNIHGYKETMAVTQFNFSSKPQSKNEEEAAAFLEAPGVYFLKCDIHPWMSAYVHVLTHPYATVTEPVATAECKPGGFVLTDVPAGTYTLVAWHEGMEETAVESGGKIAAYNYSNPEVIEVEVVVTAGKTTEVPEILFRPPAKK